MEKQVHHINDVKMLSSKFEHQVGIVETFRDDINKWDGQRRTQEAKVGEEIALVKHELDGFRYISTNNIITLLIYQIECNLNQERAS